jgi:hypothetical protein
MSKKLSPIARAIIEESKKHLGGLSLDTQYGEHADALGAEAMVITEHLPHQKEEVPHVL